MFFNFTNPPTIPMERNTFTRFLPWLVGFMVYLAVLCISIGFITKTVGNQWTAGITKNLSVQIIHKANTPLSVQKNKVERATRMLTQTDGVKNATPLSKDTLVSLLMPWLGDGLEYTNLPIPDMIDVELDTNSTVDIQKLRRTLSKLTTGIIIDSHQVWRHKIMRIVASFQNVIFTLTGLIFISAMLIVIAATRGLISMHSTTVDMLIIMGATNTFIARDFCHHALKLGTKATFYGFMLGVTTVLGLWEIGQQSGSPLFLSQWAFLSCIVFIIPLLSTLVAFITVSITLKKRFYNID